MKKLFLFAGILFLISIHKNASGQSPEYLTLSKEADSLYKVKEFRQSAIRYSEAFRLKNTGLLNDRYMAAKAWTVKENNNFRESKVNRPLIAVLDSIFDDDTKYRLTLNEVPWRA